MDELADHKIDADRVKKHLNNRPSIAKIKERTIRIAHLTDNGRVVFGGVIKVKKETNVRTYDDVIIGEL